MDITPSQWMWDLRHKISQLPLRYLPIPGSHDSGTSAINPNSLIAPESDVDWLNNLPEKDTEFARTTIANWAKTQSLSIYEQLLEGVRYLDIRLCKSESNASASYDRDKGEWDIQTHDFYTCHAMIGESLSSLLDALLRFHAQNPNEIILIDFNHFYNMTERDHLEVIQILSSSLYGKLAPNTLDLNTPVSTFWEKQCPFILFYRGADFQLPYNNAFLWSNAGISSPWPNQDNLVNLETYLSNSFGTPKNRFFVSQCILTPKAEDVLRGFFNRQENSLEKMVSANNPQLVDWIDEKLNSPAQRRNLVGPRPESRRGSRSLVQGESFSPPLTSPYTQVQGASLNPTSNSYLSQLESTLGFVREVYTPRLAVNLQRPLLNIFIFDFVSPSLNLMKVVASALGLSENEYRLHYNRTRQNVLKIN